MVKTATKTLYPELVDSNIANSVDFVKKYSNFLPRIGSISNTPPGQPQDTLVSQTPPGINEDGSYEIDVRVTAYSRNEPTSDPDTMRGLASRSNTYGPLKQGYSVAVDDKIIPYGSRVSLPNLGDNFVAMDTGGAVKSRQASRKTGGQPVIDVYFDTYEQQLAFERSYPPVVKARVYPTNSEAIPTNTLTAQTPEQANRQEGDLTPQLQCSIDYWNARKSGDPINSLITFFETLDNSSLKDFNNDFVFYWYKKLNTTIDLVKNSLNLQKDSLLNAPSDSIGLLVNVRNKFDDNVSPIFDVPGNYGAPNTIPLSCKNKISSVAMEVSNELSAKNSVLMKGNLLNLTKTGSTTSVITDTTQSHGQNLMTDYYFYQNLYKNIDGLVNTLLGEFENTKEYITYFSNINDKTAYNCRDYYACNLQQMSNIQFDMLVEDATESLDILKSKIKDSMSNRTINGVLAVAIPATKSASVTTQDINNKFLYKQRTFNVIPISKSTTAIAEARGAIDNLKIPNSNLTRLNTAVDKTGITGLPSVSNTLGPVNDLTSSITNADFIKSNNPLNMPLDLPSANLGSFPELAAIASNTSFDTSNPQSILKSIEDTKNTICDFKFPTVGDFNFDSLFDGDIDFDGETLEKRLKALSPKITLPSEEDLKKMFTNLKPNFKQIWKEFYAKYFECQEKNTA